MLFCPLDISFAGVPFKIWIGLIKIDFLAFELCSLLLKNQCECKTEWTSSDKKSIFTNPIQTFNVTPMKLSSIGEKNKTPTQQKQILSKLGPIFENYLFSKILKKLKIFKKWALPHSIFTFVGWVFYVFSPI